MRIPDERQIIRDAMDRLLEGKATNSNGALNVVSLAQEAGVKRHLLTHRHTDLRTEFYDRVRSQGHVPRSEALLREKVVQLNDTISRLREERAALNAEATVLRRMNNVLEVEKATAEEAFRSIRLGQVTSLYGDIPSQEI